MSKRLGFHLCRIERLCSDDLDTESEPQIIHKGTLHLGRTLISSPGSLGWAAMTDMSALWLAY